MTSIGQSAPVRRAVAALTVVLTLLLVATCAGRGPGTAAGPRNAAAPPRVVAAVPSPYETVPTNDGELTAAPGRTDARRHVRRATPRRSGLPGLPSAPALVHPRTPPADGTRARRHHPAGPDAAPPHALEPSALQVFRC
ncbi:hypothetical protein ACFW6S_36060 [Streptomyces sp. NPDC058740]|uniref:hypothetical protein n=1 Tax=Streptomyces sp. NPDC058740 TaxID=3346619 RepID=UPI0036755577